MNEKLLTIDVSHGTTHDGPGMRTTVFTKGCSLHCLWCQNPESIPRENGVWWTSQDCIGCGCCANACKMGAVTLDSGGLHINRELCRNCGDCAAACPTTALSRQGQEYDMDALMKEVMRDRHYYKQFGGGVTCSGGEPLLQYPFVAEFFHRLQDEGISTALDTCGNVPQENLKIVLPWTDYILFDMKLMDSNEHKRYTGAPNGRILDNLLFTANYVRHAERPMKIWIRTPLIPNITTRLENIKSIGTFIREKILDVVERWELCAFNGACAKKYEQLGLAWAFNGQGTMTETEIAPIREAAYAAVPREKVLFSGMIRA